MQALFVLPLDSLEVCLSLRLSLFIKPLTIRSLGPLLSRAGSGLADPCGVKGARGSLETVPFKLEGATSVLVHDGPAWGPRITLQCCNKGSYYLDAFHMPSSMLCA